MAQTKQQKLIMMKLKDAGVLRDYNEFDNRFKASVLERSEEKGVKLSKGGQFDLSDFPPERANVLINTIKDLKSRMLKLERKRQQKGIEQTLQETKAKEKFKGVSNADLSKKLSEARTRHEETFRVIEREKRSDLPSPKIKDIQRKHEKAGEDLFHITTEQSRRKKGVHKPVKFGGKGSPV